MFQAKCILLTRAITITTTTNNTRLRGGQETAGPTTQKLGKVMIAGNLLNTTTGELALLSSADQKILLHFLYLKISSFFVCVCAY